VVHRTRPHIATDPDRWGGPVPASIAISPRPATSGLLDRLALPAKVHAKHGLRCAIAFLIGDRHLRLARAYGERFPDEMEAFIEDTRRPLDELRRLYPFLQAGT
jgi:hypothetical protein